MKHDFTPIIRCPHCGSTRVKFKNLDVRNVDQFVEIRFCILCGESFSYIPVTELSELDAVEEILRDEDSGKS